MRPFSLQRYPPQMFSKLNNANNQESRPLNKHNGQLLPPPGPSPPSFILHTHPIPKTQTMLRQPPSIQPSLPPALQNSVPFNKQKQISYISPSLVTQQEKENTVGYQKPLLDTPSTLTEMHSTHQFYSGQNIHSIQSQKPQYQHQRNQQNQKQYLEQQQFAHNNSYDEHQIQTPNYQPQNPLLSQLHQPPQHKLQNLPQNVGPIGQPPQYQSRPRPHVRPHQLPIQNDKLNSPNHISVPLSSAISYHHSFQILPYPKDSNRNRQKIEHLKPLNLMNSSSISQTERPYTLTDSSTQFKKIVTTETPVTLLSLNIGEMEMSTTHRSTSVYNNSNLNIYVNQNLDIAPEYNSEEDVTEIFDFKESINPHNYGSIKDVTEDGTEQITPFYKPFKKPSSFKLPTTSRPSTLKKTQENMTVPTPSENMTPPPQTENVVGLSPPPLPILTNKHPRRPTTRPTNILPPEYDYIVDYNDDDDDTTLETHIISKLETPLKPKTTLKPKTSFKPEIISTKRYEPTTLKPKTTTLKYETITYDSVFRGEQEEPIRLQNTDSIVHGIRYPSYTMDTDSFDDIYYESEKIEFNTHKSVTKENDSKLTTPSATTFYQTTKQSNKYNVPWNNENKYKKEKLETMTQLVTDTTRTTSTMKPLSEPLNLESNLYESVSSQPTTIKPASITSLLTQPTPSSKLKTSSVFSLIDATTFKPKFVDIMKNISHNDNKSIKSNENPTTKNWSFNKNTYYNVESIINTSTSTTEKPKFTWTTKRRSFTRPTPKRISPINISPPIPSSSSKPKVITPTSVFNELYDIITTMSSSENNYVSLQSSLAGSGDQLAAQTDNDVIILGSEMRIPLHHEPTTTINSEKDDTNLPFFDIMKASSQQVPLTHIFIEATMSANPSESTTIFRDMFTIPDQMSIETPPIPTSYITNTKIFTVTTTKTSISHTRDTPSTILLTYTRTQTSTIVDVITRTKTIKSTPVAKTVINSYTTTYTETHTVETASIVTQPPSIIISTVTSHVNPSSINYFPNDSIFVVMTDRKTPDINQIPSNTLMPHYDEPITEVIIDNSNNNNNDIVNRDEADISNDINNVLLGGVLIASPPKHEVIIHGGVECNPECNTANNEICQRIDLYMRCVCPPGFARMFLDRPCKREYIFFN